MAFPLKQRAIVCGLDGSYIARAATITAAAFAARLECPLLLMYIPDQDDPAIRQAGTVEQARRAAAEAAQRIVTPVFDEHRVQAEVIVELGAPVTALIEAAEAREAQLLVVGSHGGGKGGGPLGGLSRRMVRHAPCPVIVVPPRAATMLTPLVTKSRREPVIVCGIDDQHAVRTLLFAVDLAARMHARLVFVHALDARLAGVQASPTATPCEDGVGLDAGHTRAHALLETGTGVAMDQGVRAVAGQLASGDPAEAVRLAAESEAADLIVVGNRGRGPLRSALLGSVSSDLADAAATPIAILPASAHIAPLSGHYELLFGRSDRVIPA